MSQEVSSGDIMAYPSNLINEIRIPVPWGVIAAKSWGDSTSEPVLCIHGAVDNANSFDRLIPLLPDKFYYICIDLPGHGKSSHFTRGIPYRLTDYVTCLMRVCRHFKWQNLNIIGHHIGGFLGLLFACAAPVNIARLIIINSSAKILTRQQHVDQLRLNASNLLACEGKGNDTPANSRGELLNRLLSLRGAYLPHEYGTILLSRSECFSDYSYHLDIDNRVVNIEYPILNLKQTQQLLSKINCKLLVITSDKAEKLPDMLPIQSFNSVFKSHCKHYEHFVVHGGRDIHIVSPEQISSKISHFLLKLSSKL